MNKLNYCYLVNSTKLNIEGLPDISLNQSLDTIGILSKWQLELLGNPLLEGKRHHLESLLSVVLPYARYFLSGVPKEFGSSLSPVTISPDGTSHQIILRSSDVSTDPLKIVMDDAELADLVRCLDQLIGDKRVGIVWNLPEYKPLKYREKLSKKLLSQRISAFLIAISSLLSISLIYLYIPEPTLIRESVLKSKEISPKD